MTTPEDRFQQAVEDDLVPRLDKAAMGLLMHPDARVDAHFAVQLGAMVLLDKPIMVVVDPDYEVPAKLRAIADEIVVWKMGTDKKPLEEALLRMAERFGPTEGPTEDASVMVTPEIAQQAREAAERIMARDAKRAEEGS